MLDQAITLSDVQEVSNPDGSLTMSHTNTVKLFARVRPLSGTERYIAGQVRAPAIYRFKIRNREVDESQVISWRGKIYNVRFVGTAGTRDRYINIDAEKDVAQ